MSISVIPQDVFYDNPTIQQLHCFIFNLPRRALRWYILHKYCIPGKSAIFRAMVSGEPAPNVTWSRNKGDTADPQQYKARYDDRNNEYIFEVKQISFDFELGLVLYVVQSQKTAMNLDR